MAALRSATAPTGLALLRAVARRLPLDLQARARRNAWAGRSELAALARARREAEAALAAASPAPADPAAVADVPLEVPERLAR